MLSTAGRAGAVVGRPDSRAIGNGASRRSRRPIRRSRRPLRGAALGIGRRRVSSFVEGASRLRPEPQVAILFGRGARAVGALRRGPNAVPRISQRRSQAALMPRKLAFAPAKRPCWAGIRSAAREALAGFRRETSDRQAERLRAELPGQIAVSDGDAAPRRNTMYREAIERFPHGCLQDDYRYGLARALELEGKRPEAEKLYRQLADGADKALAEQSMLRLATSQSAGGRYADAAETFEAFETKYPASKQLAQARTEHARALYQLGKYDAARSDSGAIGGRSQSGDEPISAGAGRAGGRASRCGAQATHGVRADRAGRLAAKNSNWREPHR